MASLPKNPASDLLLLRPLTDADLPFLRVLYRSLREDELRLLPSDLVEPFITQQFDAQYRHYTENYDTSRYAIIEYHQQAIGRLFVDLWPAEIRVVDIALLPDHRGKGIGTRLLHDLCDEADRDGLVLSIHVERNNPARHLYARLGFLPEEIDNAVYLLMKRPANAA